MSAVWAPSTLTRAEGTGRQIAVSDLALAYLLCGNEQIRFHLSSVCSSMK